MNYNVLITFLTPAVIIQLMSVLLLIFQAGDFLQTRVFDISQFYILVYNKFSHRKAKATEQF